MRILYVTSLWDGLADLVLRQREEASGMPGFVRPLQKLVDLGPHVGLLIAAPQPGPLEFDPVPWTGSGLGFRG